MKKAIAAQELATQLGKLIAHTILFNEQVASKVGMSSSEMQSIHLLQLHGPLTPSELSRFTGLKSGSMTAVLDRLEKLGFTARRPHPTDRRKIIIEANHARIANTLAPYYKEKARHTQEAMDPLTAQELIVIARFLEELTDNSK